MIVAGTKYQRHVERLGSHKGKDPLRNIHMHLDCQAPWYQPGDLPHRLRQVGSLPGNLPPADIHDTSRPFMRPAVSVSNEAIGTLMWKLPPGAEAKIAFCPSTNTQMGAIGEIEQALSIVLTALIGSIGNKRQSQKLSNLINEIASHVK